MNRRAKLPSHRSSAVASVFALVALLCAFPVLAPAQQSEDTARACATDAALGASSARCILRADIERVKDIQRRHEERILAIGGVLGIGIGKAQGEPRAVLVILVDKSMPLPPLPQQIEGIEVRVERRAPVRLLDGGAGCSPCHRDQFPPPVRMGNSGGLAAIQGSCTMGFKACDLGTAKMVFVTNSHCNIVQPAPVCGLVTPGGIVDEWTHPGLFEQIGDPYEIGNVSGHAAPTCGATNNLTDATKVTSPNALTSIAVRDVQYYLSLSPGDPMPGDSVQTSGRTTGYATGDVTTINMTIPVQANGGFCCGALTMKGQVEWLPVEPTGPGDSGSGLLSTEAPPRVVGLSWGGDGTFTYSNHIANVLSALNLTLDLTACLADCVYARAARTLPPGGTSIVDFIFTPTGLIELGHRFRGQVLQRSAVGQQFIGYFYQFSDEAIAIAGRSPGLLLRSAQALVTIAPSVVKLIESGEAKVPAAHLQIVDETLAAYEAGASAELLAAIRDTRDGLRSPRVLSALGIKVEGAWNLTQISVTAAPYTNRSR